MRGYFGDYCNISCPGGSLCANQACERYTGKCKGCVVDHYGEECAQTCETCVDGRCNQDTGMCLSTCEIGFHGAKCDQECHTRCTQCEQLTGYCEVCDVGTYGSACQHNCSSHCALTGNGELACNRLSGDCDSGRCNIGYFLPTCTLRCSANCFNVACELGNGNCTFGCNVGWYGRQCDAQCSENCVNRNCINAFDNCVIGCVPEYYGPRCNTLCNRNCFGGVCDDNGRCSMGCLNGYYGDMCDKQCNETCTDDRCDRDVGNCAECRRISPNWLCRTASKYGFFSFTKKTLVD